MSSQRTLEIKHEMLCADEVVEFQYRLLISNAIRSFQAQKPPKPIKIHGLCMDRFFRERDLGDVCARGTPNRAAFFPGGTPSYTEDL